MRAWIGLAALLTLAFGAAPVSADELLSLLPGPAGNGITDWKGFVELRPRRYLQDSRGAATDEQVLVWAEAEIDFRLGADLTGFLRPRIYSDLGTEGFDRLHVPELFLTYEAAGWDLRGGVLVEDWGIADTFNPIDVLNPRDLGTEFLDPLKLGQAGIRLRRLLAGGEVLGEPTVAVYWMPVFERTRFAPRGQRFHPAPVGHTFEEAGVVPRGARRTLWAVRFKSTLETALLSSDLQLLASRGPDRSPPLYLAAAGTLAPAYQEVRTVGLGLRAVPEAQRLGHFLSTLTVKLELAHRSFSRYRHSPHPASEDYWTMVLGVDRQLPNLLRGHDLLTLTLEYVSESGAADAASKQRLFQHDLVVRALWQANDFNRSTVELRAVLDPLDDEAIVELSFATRLRALGESLSEDLRIELGFRYFDHRRDSGTALGGLPDNSSISLGLRWDLAP